MRASIRVFTAAVIGALLASGTGLALATQQDDPAAEPPSIMEDFSYPGATQVLAQRGITLISGDGHIMLVSCGASGLIEVRSSGNTADKDPDPGHYCFKVTGSTGTLTLTIPNAYQVKGDNHAVTATVTVANTTSTVAVATNTWTGIGLGSGPDPATLLQLDAKS
ncbi:hypothetical protein FHX82_007270 [Amycolatopsis bartoniae]|uniref:Secreted protein n=1 Tax=Amycolatopsis bartoniae TaxID=941986 RepID=A0A8H9MAJ6_9PSEU|nr:hypothetical protein [Amycolatopsis bartoniae]MBB2940184.1 hypothetical protein [Amycolatopsis bartoniae]TVS99394.1 hypothetical protein FNH07_34935 [Amycolatopsis bartoniae]GHF37137.1 secreted protein [Amycolatopsis bartoniae]